MILQPYLPTTAHTRVMHFDDAQNSIDVPVIDRLSLKQADLYRPAVVEQADTTTVVSWVAGNAARQRHLVLTQ